MSSSHDVYTEAETRVKSTIRMAIGAAGLTAVIAGLMILVAPEQSAKAVAAIIAVYALVEGFVNLVIALFSKSKSGWGRVGYALLGVLFLVAAVVALQNLSILALTLAVTISIIIGILWIVEGVVSLTQLGDASSKIWTIIFAALSIIAGVILLSSPLWSAVVLWWVLGVSLVVLGFVQVVRAFRFGH